MGEKGNANQECKYLHLSHCQYIQEAVEWFQQIQVGIGPGHLLPPVLTRAKDENMTNEMPPGQVHIVQIENLIW